MILDQQSFTVHRRELAQQSVFNYLVVLEDVDIQEEIQQNQRNINHTFKDRILTKNIKYDEQSHTTTQNRRQNNNFDEISHVTRQNKKQNGFKFDEQSHTTRKYQRGQQPTQNVNNLYVQGRSINRQFDEQSATTQQHHQRTNKTQTSQNNLNVVKRNNYDDISSVTSQDKLLINSRNQMKQFDEVSGVTNNSQKKQNFDDISSVTQKKTNQSVNRNQDISHTTQRNNQMLQIELNNVSKSFLTYFNYYKQQNPQHQNRPRIVKHLSNFTLKKSEDKIKTLIETLFADFKNKSKLTFNLQVHVYEKLYENNKFVSQQIMKEEPIEMKITLPFYKQQINKIEFLINQAQPWLNHYYEQTQKDQFDEKINQKLQVNKFFTRRNKLQFKANWMDFKKGVLQIMIQATVPFQDEDFMNYKRGNTVFDDGRYLIS